MQPPSSLIFRMGATQVAKSASPPADTSTTPSKKRKAEIDEIEVDLSLPEPPSKKAKRLIKKGKPLPVKPDSDDEPEDELPIPKAGKDSKDGKPKRSEHGIWIGNLPFTVTRVELFKWLVENSGGAIKEENITRVNLPTSKVAKDKRHAGAVAEAHKPQNKGFAYVDFDAEPAAVAAMALTETELAGRKVLIKNSKSFDGRPQKEAANENSGGDGGPNGSNTSAGKGGDKHNGSRKIYVGNLSFQTGEDDLRAQFDKCGEIEWAKVATFEDSGKCKGYGWVKFKEAEAAEWAVKGFVKIKEEVEMEDDFRDDAAAGDGDDDAEDGGKQEKKFKTRKWWVNRLRGRELRIDFAEDDQLRYKKRFGKDAPARAADKGQGGSRGDRHGKETPRDPHHNSGGERADAASGKDNTETGVPGKRPKKIYGDAGVASYLTGAVVKSLGKKITFDK
ncbi:hypothetical protein F5X99DRAFT_395525 [Biscogniauxia marginata]|nr:hypothetical protein F5X99DRAFT_395525 [Biscogniauxia marginata]